VERVKMPNPEYYNIRLQRHFTMRAEGLPVETYISLAFTTHPWQFDVGSIFHARVIVHKDHSPDVVAAYARSILVEQD
jgi:hypothetical protein